MHTEMNDLRLLKMKMSMRMVRAAVTVYVEDGSPASVETTAAQEPWERHRNHCAKQRTCPRDMNIIWIYEYMNIWIPSSVDCSSCRVTHRPLSQWLKWEVARGSAPAPVWVPLPAVAWGWGWAPGVNETMVLSMLKTVILCSKCAKFPTPSKPPSPEPPVWPDHFNHCSIAKQRR